MTPIRSLDIRPKEAWTPGRVALHMAATTLPALRERKPAPIFTWRLIAYLAVLPTVAATAAIVAYRLFRWGVL